MSGPESTMWKWLKEGLRPFGSEADVNRIETDTESGYPDVEGCILGVSFVCELKVAHYVRKRDATFALKHYTSKQAYKLHKRAKAGGRAYLMVRVGDRHYLVKADKALDVHDRRMALSEAYLAEVGMPVDPASSSHRFWKEVIRSLN